MNQELMTLDFWQDTVIYEGKTGSVKDFSQNGLQALV